MSKGFWDYLAHWQKVFPHRRAVSWREGWLQNGYCRDCRYCCGPQDSNELFPMGLLPEQLRPGLANDFYLLNKDTAFMDGRGCRSCTNQGCRLPRPERPVACGLFPFVLNAGEMYLYQICPASLFTPMARMAELGREAADWLAKFSQQEQEHIALNLPAAVLTDRYINLHIRVYNPTAWI